MSFMRRQCGYWAVQPFCLVFFFFVFLLFCVFMFWNQGGYTTFCVVCLFSEVSRILFVGVNPKGVSLVCGGFRPFERYLVLLANIGCLYSMLRI